ncbi:MAG: MerR family transcriptional regulator [Acidobacteria bacterium]|nr:MerR family transcriptional regulator [Acidobacteriota bacterium]
MYQASEFARLTGVTVRALHHYDRVGLLKPSGRTGAGYRLYGAKDVARLQQIVTLKFIGLSLKQIKEALDRDSFELAGALRMQREILGEKRRHLEMAIGAIEQAEQVMAAKGEPDWKTFAKIIEVINMQNEWEWVKKYYTEEQLQELQQRATPELLEQAQQDWAVLLREVNEAVSEGVDPASERAQGLAARWSALIESFTGGNPAIAQSLSNLYRDQANWPAHAQKPFTDDAMSFINKARAANAK